MTILQGLLSDGKTLWLRNVNFHNSGKYRLWNVDLDLNLIKFDFHSGKYRLWNVDLDLNLIKFDFHSGKYRLWNVDLDLDLIKFDFNSGKYRLWNIDFHENKLLWHLFWCLF